MKKILLIISLVFVLLFAGCSGSSGTQRGTNQLDSFNGGDSGLSLTFREESPPFTIRDQGLQPFSVAVLVENNGEFDISDNSAHVVLSGFDTTAFELADTSKEVPALRGFKKQGTNVIPGLSQPVIFSNLKYTESLVSGSIPMTMYANVCYPYQTKAVALVCINGDTIPAIDKRAEICEISGDKEYANSGAPVKIENVQEFPYGEHSIQIQFDIVHSPTSSSANLYESGSINSDCNIAGNAASSSDALFQRDKVTYIIDSGIAGLDCEGTGTNTNTVSLINNKYTITCVQDTTGQSEYQKPISITLDYDYLDRIGKDITIEHIGIN